LIKGENMSVADTGVQKSQKNFQSPSPVSTLGSQNPKCPRNPIAMLLHSRSTNVVEGATQN